MLLRSYCLNRSLKKVLTPLTSYDDRPDCTSIPAVGDNPKRPACDRPDTPEGDVVFRHTSKMGLEGIVSKRRARVTGRDVRRFG